MGEETEKAEERSVPSEGERVKAGDPKWLKIFPKPDEVLEFVVNVKKDGGESIESVVCALIVTDIALMKDAGMVVSGRVIGATDEEYLKELHLEVNRRKKGIHLCAKELPLLPVEGAVASTTEVAVWKAKNFPGDYLKPWGSLVLKEVLEKGPEFEGPTEGPPKKRRGDVPKKRPAAASAKTAPSPKRVRKRRELSGKGRGGGGSPLPAGNKQLAEQLASLKMNLLGKVKDTVIDLEDPEYDHAGGPGEDESGSGSAEHPPPCKRTVKEERRLASGGHLNPRRSLLALMNGSPDEATRDGSSRKPRRRRSGSSQLSKHPAQQLLAVAAEQGRCREDKRKQRKRGGSEDGRKGKDGEDRNSRKRKKEKKKKKVKKEKKERKKKRRGHPGGDSGGSSSSDSESSRSSASSSSESSSLLAPLQRKSREEPGAVLKMLVKHARETLDQSALVDTEESKDITRGVKLSSYFSLMLRPYYSTSSRDMKELFHLANCVDQLRSGQLGLLGDSLASRFLAIHCAMVEGTWKSAQYLELNPLDAPTSAPTPVLLEAKRHAKLIYKSQSHESYKKNSEWDWKGGEERKGKGKQKGKKGGKGKWRSGNGRGDWDNWQKDSWWERNRDKKDGKDAKEDAKEKK